MPLAAHRSLRPRRDVVLRRPAMAEGFVGVGQPHQTIAVPGVALAPGDALVEVELSTVCPADLDLVSGVIEAPTPLVLGHESVGRVVALGDDGVDAADGTALRLGDRVVWSVAVPCGRPDALGTGDSGENEQTWKYGHDRIGANGELTGTFATHVQLLEGTAIVRVPEAMPAAALAPASCTTASAWAAVAELADTRPLTGAMLTVRGANLLGLTITAVATHLGAVVDVVDPASARQVLGERFGAVASTGEPDAVIDVSALTPWQYGPDDLVAAVAFLADGGRAYPFADAVGAVFPLQELDAALVVAAQELAPLRVAVSPR